MSTLFAVHLESEQDHTPTLKSAVEWSTPPSVFNPLHDEFGFTLDVCASKGNAKCARFYTRSDDGLQQDWSGETVWMNPPYARGVIDAWMRKAYESSQQGATVVCLVPSSTSTAWWHDYAMRGEVRYVRGRIRFGGSPHAAMFANAGSHLSSACGWCEIKICTGTQKHWFGTPIAQGPPRTLRTAGDAPPHKRPSGRTFCQLFRIRVTEW